MRVPIQRKTMIGALRMVYWLGTEEVAHTTKFTMLMDLSVQMGCEYLCELHLGGNAHYSSEQTISKLL